MIKDGLNKRLKITEEGILIPNDIWISGNYYVTQNEATYPYEKVTMTIQFYRFNKPEDVKAYFGSMKFELSKTLNVGEYVLIPDEDTKKRILNNSFCVVLKEKRVDLTEDLKEKYSFRLYSVLYNRSITTLSKIYPNISDLEGEKLSNILAIRGISKSGLLFIWYVLDDLKLNVINDVFETEVLENQKEETYDHWVII